MLYRLVILYDFLFPILQNNSTMTVANKLANIPKIISLKKFKGFVPIRQLILNLKLIKSADACWVKTAI